MKVFIIGISGAVGGLLARELVDRGDDVTGLVRRADQRDGLRAGGIEAHVAERAELTADTLAGVGRFALVSVLPEAGRGHDLGEDVEFYFAVKKLVDVTVSMSTLDWLILRPSLLVDRPGTGRVSLSPAQPHDEIPREDVVASLAELLHEPRVSRRILEVTQGATPIARAVLTNVP